MVATRCVLLLVLAYFIVPCRAFAEGRPAKCSFSAAKASARPARASEHHHPHPLTHLRGGAAETSSLQASLGDYSEAARIMFVGLITPATLVITSIVPLTLQEIKLPQYGKNALKKKLRGLYYVIGLLSTCSELICVIIASISASRLLQTTSKPATSVFALIQRDYELAWIAAMTHFLGGLLGFITVCGLGAYLSFPPKYNIAGAGFAAAASTWLLGFANTRSVMFQKTNMRNCFVLLKRYVVLATKQLRISGPNVLAVVSVVLTGISIGLLVRALVSDDE